MDKTLFVTMEKAQNRVLNTVGSSRIRAKWLWRNWTNADEYHLGDRADVLIFQKVYWDDMIENFKGIKIFDICDPDWYEKDREVFKFLHQCDAIVTSTQSLADYIKKLIPDKIVTCIPDRVDLVEHKEQKKQHARKLQKLVWFGYSHNYKYLSGTFKFLIKKGLEITLISDSEYNPPEQYKALKVDYQKYYYPTLHNDLIKYDAALLPTKRNDIDFIGRFKSNNKNVTCWALGLPVVDKLEDLDRLETKKARIKEAKDKLRLVDDKYDVLISVQEYQQLIKKIKNDKTD